MPSNISRPLAAALLVALSVLSAKCTPAPSASSGTPPGKPASTPPASPPATAGVRTVAAELPPWLRAKIAAFEKSKRGTSPDAVWRYLVDGKPVYYFRSGCCDQYNELFDAGGHYLCAPDGGFTGKGDMKCSKAQMQPSAMDMVWQDPRIGLTVNPAEDKTK